MVVPYFSSILIRFSILSHPAIAVPPFMENTNCGHSIHLKWLFHRQDVRSSCDCRLWADTLHAPGSSIRIALRCACVPVPSQSATLPPPQGLQHCLLPDACCCCPGRNGRRSRCCRVEILAAASATEAAARAAITPGLLRRRYTVRFLPWELRVAFAICPFCALSAAPIAARPSANTWTLSKRSRTSAALLFSAMPAAAMPLLLDDATDFISSSVAMRSLVSRIWGCPRPRKACIKPKDPRNAWISQPYSLNLGIPNCWPSKNLSLPYPQDHTNPLVRQIRTPNLGSRMVFL